MSVRDGHLRQCVLSSDGWIPRTLAAKDYDGWRSHHAPVLRDCRPTGGSETCSCGVCGGTVNVPPWCTSHPLTCRTRAPAKLTISALRAPSRVPSNRYVGDERLGPDSARHDHRTVGIAWDAHKCSGQRTHRMAQRDATSLQTPPDEWSVLSSAAYPSSRSTTSILIVSHLCGRALARWSSRQQWSTPRRRSRPLLLWAPTECCSACAG